MKSLTMLEKVETVTPTTISAPQARQPTSSSFKMNWSLEAQTKLARRFVAEYEGWLKGPKIAYHRKWSEELDIEHASAERIAMRIKSMIKSYETAWTLSGTINQEGLSVSEENAGKRIEKNFQRKNHATPGTSNHDINPGEPKTVNETATKRSAKTSNDPAYKSARLLYKRHKLETKRYIADLKHKEKMCWFEYKMRKLNSRHANSQRQGLELAPFRNEQAQASGLSYYETATHRRGAQSRPPTAEMMVPVSQTQAGVAHTKQPHRVPSNGLYGISNPEVERQWQDLPAGWETPKGGWF